MAYFNGDLHGRNDAEGYHAPKPMTRLYCDSCAETGIPLRGAKGDVGRHWHTDFKWAPRYGDKCHSCKKDC